MHGSQSKAEECGAVQPSQEEPGPWSKSVSGLVIHGTTSRTGRTAKSKLDNGGG